jgi:hypothetical protein
VIWLSLSRCLTIGGGIARDARWATASRLQRHDSPGALVGDIIGARQERAVVFGLLPIGRDKANGPASLQVLDDVPEDRQ